MDILWREYWPRYSNKINTNNIIFCIKGVILITVLSIINHYPVIEFTLNNKDILYRTTKVIQPVNLYNLFRVYFGD